MIKFFTVLAFLFLMACECFAPAGPGSVSNPDNPPAGVITAIGYYAIEITEEENIRRANRVAEIQALYPNSECYLISFYNSHAKQQTLALIRNPLDEAAIERIMLFTQHAAGDYQQAELVEAKIYSVEAFNNFHGYFYVCLVYERTNGFFYAKKVDVSNEGITLIDDTSVIFLENLAKSSIFGG